MLASNRLYRLQNVASPASPVARAGAEVFFSGRKGRETWPIWAISHPFRPHGVPRGSRRGAGRAPAGVGSRQRGRAGPAGLGSARPGRRSGVWSSRCQRSASVAVWPGASGREGTQRQGLSPSPRDGERAAGPFCRRRQLCTRLPESSASRPRVSRQSPTAPGHPTRVLRQSEPGVRCSRLSEDEEEEEGHRCRCRSCRWRAASNTSILW